MIDIAVSNDFQHSDSLQAHIERRLGSALRRHAHHIRRVNLRLRDANGPRRGDDDKVAQVTLTMAPSGRVLATGRAGDVYVSVNRAAARAREAVARYLTRTTARGRHARR